MAAKPSSKNACQNCGNLDWLVFRRHRKVCVNCAALNPEWSRVGQGRTYAPDHPNFMDPVNHPVAVTTAGTRKPCVWCTSLTPSTYEHMTNRLTFNACSWGHAGYWLDTLREAAIAQESEAETLAEGEAYVRASLGMGES